MPRFHPGSPGNVPGIAFVSVGAAALFQAFVVCQHQGFGLAVSWSSRFSVQENSLKAELQQDARPQIKALTKR
jgi:hypothetical protein